MLKVHKSNIFANQPSSIHEQNYRYTHSDSGRFRLPLLTGGKMKEFFKELFFRAVNNIGDRIRVSGGYSNNALGHPYGWRENFNEKTSIGMVYSGLAYLSRYRGITMTRILLFSLIISCWAMGATIDLDDTVYHCTTDCGAMISVMPDSVSKSLFNASSMNYQFQNPKIVVTADQHLILDSLSVIGTIYPGDCLTVDSNQTLIRCPIKAMGYLHSTKIIKHKSKKFYGSCRDAIGMYCIVEFDPKSMITCPDTCPTTYRKPK